MGHAGVDPYMTDSFGVTYDYRCPFARNAHEHVVAGLRAGAPWDVEFLPFSLSQAHVEEGAPDIWDGHSKDSHLLGTEAGLVVRDRYPDQFLAVHVALFAARHDEGRDLREEAVVRDILTANGVNADDVMSEVAEQWPRNAFRKSHEAAVADHHVFGVPTFIVGDKAVFVRIMTRPGEDGALARRTIDHILDEITGYPEINEFKHTTIAH